MSSSPNSAASAETDATPWLAHVPVGLFAVVMGVGGLAAAWRLAGEVLGLPGWIGETFAVVATLAFLAIAGLYARKTITRFQDVKQEFLHPVRSSFFGAITVSLMILAGLAMPYSTTLALPLWVLGAVGHMALTVVLANRWINTEQNFTMLSPAWFIPAVGNVIVPVTGVPLGMVELSWFSFSAGILFWVVLFAVVLHRILFHNPLPERLLPTMLILVAPPAIGAVAYSKLIGADPDSILHILVHGALFLGLINLANLRRFLALPFFVSWWAYTFPLDALALAVMTLGHLTGSSGLLLLGGVLLGVATLVVSLVALRTVQALIKGSLFQPE